VVRGDDELPVELEPRQRSDRRAGGDDEVLGLKLLRPDLEGVPVADPPSPFDELDLVLLMRNWTPLWSWLTMVSRRAAIRV
jgi:hypothetical protein